MRETVRTDREKEVTSGADRGSRELERLIGRTRDSLLELVVQFGIEAFQELLEEDMERLCGPRSSRSDERQAYRHGREPSRLSVGGRRVRMDKPRVRSVAGTEMALPTWERYRDQDPLGHRALEQILCGVSSRKYQRSLESIGDLETSGITKSSVSRQFVARTKRQVESFLSRPLGVLDLPVLMLDGVEMGRHLLIVALGIDSEGHKHVLGVVEGAAESSEVCRRLLRQLIERGLEVERPRLIVTDGSKGLEKAIRLTFGSRYRHQRCRQHKTRNVMAHLPAHARLWWQVRLRAAWKEPSADQAKQQLLALANELDGEYPGAADSLREGLDETLTVTRLGLSGALLQTLRSTNPIENMHDSMKRVARNVKRWRGGSMVVRWGVTALMDAETQFRRIRGFRDIPALNAALAATIAPEVDTQAISA